MFRRAACLALVASGVILLSSCSAGQPVPAASTAGTISGHLGPPTASAGAPSQSPAASPQAPTSSGPADGVPVTAQISPNYTEVFATPLPADPARARVMSSFRESQIVWDLASVTLRLTKATTSYVTGSALTTLLRVLANFTKNNLVSVGSDRLFDTRITSLTTHLASLTTCDDGSLYGLADRTSGKVMAPAPPTQEFDLAIFTMIPLKGHWALSTVKAVAYPDPRVKACIQSASRSLHVTRASDGACP